MVVPPLLPTPRVLEPRPGGFRIRPEVPIVLGERATESDFQSAVALREAVAERSGIRLSIETHARRDDLGPRLELSREGAFGEGYRLEVGPDCVRAEGGGPAGLRYAVSTLSQLLVPGAASLPGCRIEDAPDLAMRGLLVDVSRGKVPTLATLKDLVDWMVSLKLNLLMLYTEHVFRFRRHPRIGEDASPMEAWEIRELDAYAAHRHVELVPTLQSLGHMHHVLKHPGYAGLAESERRWSISPALEESYALLDDLYSEYLPNFRSGWFNANCDEPVDLGKGLSRSWAEKEGLGAVFCAHLERVRSLAEKYGKKTMVWADVVHEHPETLGRIPRDMVLLDWWYEADHDFERVRIFAENGIPFLAAAGTSSWNTLFPRMENALANIRGHAAAAKRFGARGLLTTDWGDGGHGNLLGNSLYPFAFGAQAAWGSAELPRKDFDRAFALQIFWDSSGAAARLYRSLGALHETGFPHFNHSPLKSLFLDDLREAKFIPQAKPRALRSTLAKLERVRRDFEASKVKLGRRPLEREELQFAIEASIVAAEKGLAGLEALRLPRRPHDLRGGGRIGLAARLERLAGAQRVLLRWLERLWRKRNRRSNFELIAAQYEASISGLRRAAQAAGRKR